ncbi:MAG: PEP-CTERM sorting domain-containing protein [Microcoleus sp.]
MKNPTLDRILGIIGGTIFSIGTGLAVATPKAEAAVLTYNFQATTTGWNAGTYDGYFKIDNSSLTGIGEEAIPISEGVFNFLASDGTPMSYSLRSLGSQMPFRGTSPIPGVDPPGVTGMSAVDIAAFMLDGNFLGLSIGRLGAPSLYVSSISSNRVLIDEGMRLGVRYTYYMAQILHLTVNPYSDVIEGYLSVPRHRLLLNEIRPYQGTVTYSGPTRVVGDIAVEPVPEPMTVAGTTLALAGFAAFKRKKNQQQLS